KFSSENFYGISTSSNTCFQLWFQIDPFFTAPQKKMLFVSIWSSFAIALYLLNAEKKRKTYSVIPEFKPWKAFVLSCTAFVGGLNSIIGVYYRVVWAGGVSPLALDYIKITIPVAVTLAPLGSFLGSHFHRKVSLE
ncbi:hypothetical protein GCK32_021901, partial [Trichostrongylus colubriformis]